MDYSDVQVIVYELTKKGYWSHEHVNPLYLEVEFPPDIKDDKKSHKFRAAIEALGDYITFKSKGRSYPAELIIKTAKAYAEIYCEKSHWEKIVDEISVFMSRQEWC